MNPTTKRHSLTIPKIRTIPLLAIILAACFLPGCSKPADHARTAMTGSIDLQKRIKAVQALNDAALLAGIAKNARDMAVRAEAAAKIASQNSR